jgi:hypothetical protein
VEDIAARPGAALGAFRGSRLSQVLSNGLRRVEGRPGLVAQTQTETETRTRNERLGKRESESDSERESAREGVTSA